MFKKLSRHAAATAFALAVGAGAAAAQTASAQTATPAPTQTPVVAATPVPAPSTAGHEYAPLIEQKIDYKDWTFKSLKDGSPVNLREWAKGKKLVMVVYFAPWCGNWKMEAPVVARLLDKYRKDGFDVVAVSEYAAAADSRKHFDSQGGAPYTVVVESEAREARDQTTHYAYRQIANDTRRWGSPFNVFLEPSRLNAKGDVLAEKTWVVGGELIERDAEQFIREKLGLTEKTAVEPCEVKP
ncbi:MAG: redoxin family protein [Acidobacteria bacterium]|nr:redoxin family protein [Acidobacteriota bacterium]